MKKALTCLLLLVFAVMLSACDAADTSSSVPVSSPASISESSPESTTTPASIGSLVGSWHQMERPQDLGYSYLCFFVFFTDNGLMNVLIEEMVLDSESVTYDYLFDYTYENGKLNYTLNTSGLGDPVPPEVKVEIKNGVLMLTCPNMWKEKAKLITLTMEKKTNVAPVGISVQERQQTKEDNQRYYDEILQFVELLESKTGVQLERVREETTYHLPLLFTYDDQNFYIAPLEKAGIRGDEYGLTVSNGFDYTRSAVKITDFVVAYDDYTEYPFVETLEKWKQLIEG